MSVYWLLTLNFEGTACDGSSDCKDYTMDGPRQTVLPGRPTRAARNETDVRPSYRNIRLYRILVVEQREGRHHPLTSLDGVVFDVNVAKLDQHEKLSARGRDSCATLCERQCYDENIIAMVDHVTNMFPRAIDIYISYLTPSISIVLMHISLKWNIYIGACTYVHKLYFIYLLCIFIIGCSVLDG